MDQVHRREHRPGFIESRLRHLRARQELHRGFGDALSQAFELVFTPAIFAIGGYLLDQRVGTKPLFTLLFFLLVFAYEVWKLFARYSAAMRAQEARFTARGRQERPS